MSRHKRFPKLFQSHREALIADMVRLRTTIHSACFDLKPSSPDYVALQALHQAVLAGFDALGYDWQSIDLPGPSGHTTYAGKAR